MYDLINELFDSMTLGFGKPMNLRFSTPNTKDIMPSYWSRWYEGEGDKEEKGYKCVARTIGINPEDINVSVEDYGILIEGETDVEGTKYSQHIELPISKELMRNVKGINYKTLNGLTYVYLEINKTQVKKLEAKRIK